MSRYTTALTILLVVLAGCAGGNSVQTGAESGAGGGFTLTGEADAARATPVESGVADGAEYGAADDTAQVDRGRELIRTARVGIVVDDFETARERLAAYAESTGGFVGDSTRRVEGAGNRTWTVGRVTLRVPTSNYTEALAVVNETGEVRASEQSTRDVTDQVVDLEARLENLREERDQLRALYRRANTTEDVLAVQQELSRVQTEIERTEAQLQQLERQVAFTTITVEIREPRPDPPDDLGTAWYDTPVTSAFLESIDGVVVFLQSTVVLTAYALPYLVVVGLPLGGGLYAVRRYRRRPTTESTANGTGTADGDSGGTVDLENEPDDDDN